MIDHAGFRRFNPNCNFNLSVERQLDHDSLDDVQYMLCTPIILGYSFGVKKWGTTLNLSLLVFLTTV